jgi:hypothetical protein
MENTDTGLGDWKPVLAARVHLSSRYRRPLHRHIRADQAIYVLEGELEILADSKSFFFTKGETCLIRRGALHREINSSRSETRFITIHSPGFFSEFIRLAGIPVPVGTKVPPLSTPNIDEARKLVEIGLEFDV